MKSFTATTNDNDVRLSRFCEKLCPTMPKSMLYKSFRNKRIKVNGKRVSEKDIVTDIKNVKNYSFEWGTINVWANKKATLLVAFKFAHSFLPKWYPLLCISY